MCFGGTNDATQAEAAMNAATQARTAKNVNDINSAFAGRGGQYADYGNALNQQYQTELGRQNTIAARNQKFGLAASGLTGGSAAADSGQLLGQDMAKGTLAAQQQVQGDVAGLEAKDQATKQQLISLAQSGNNIGNAAVMSGDALRANLGQAQSTNVANSLGNVFGDVATNTTNMQTAAQYRKGYLQGTSGSVNPYSTSIAGPSPG